MVEGWLVYNRGDYEKNREYADRFTTGCGKYGLSIVLRFSDDISFTLVDNRLAANGGRLPAFVINRTRDWLLGRSLEQAGCRVFNSAEASRVGNDKVESHLLAARLGLPQVGMAFCQNQPDAVVRHGLGYPVVLKNPRGHGGSEVFLARSEKELLRLAAALPCGRVLIQKVCGMPGADVRVYVLGNRILSAVKRRSTGGFRANLSLGGTVEYHQLSNEEIDMTGKVLSALPLDYAGVDFIYDENMRPLFNEIEDAVGSRSLYQLGGPDTADLYLKYIAEQM